MTFTRRTPLSVGAIAAIDAAAVITAPPDSAGRTWGSADTASAFTKDVTPKRKAAKWDRSHRAAARAGNRS